MSSETSLRDLVTQKNVYTDVKVGLKEQLKKEYDRLYEEGTNAARLQYELSVVRAKKEGNSMAKIAKACDVKGTAFIYEILDRLTPEWRDPKFINVDIAVPQRPDAPEAPKNFRFKEDWAFIDLYFPGVADVPGGYYTYRIEDRRDPHFETASVQTAIELEKIPGKGIDYWEANAYNAIVTIGKGQDYAEFKRVHMDPKGLTEDMIRGGWEKAND